MLKHGGYWWPDNDEIAHKTIPRFAGLSMPRAHTFFRGRELAIQAGGNVGLYPIYLSGHFKRVLTFEPELENFRCLRKNCEGIANISYTKAALGDHTGTVGIKRSKDNFGAHLVTEGNMADVVRIDDMRLPACDFIWLSVNGYHMKVFAGAEQTIAKHKPVIVFEELNDFETEATDWLMARGYEVCDQLPLRDYVMMPC